LRVSLNRFLEADTLIMHPRRWAWFLAQSDTAGRPLVVPQPQGPYNAFGATNTDQVNQTTPGLVGSIGGLDVIVDSLIPTNIGTTQEHHRRVPCG
jgi:hypothetical protein